MKMDEFEEKDKCETCPYRDEDKCPDRWCTYWDD